LRSFYRYEYMKIKSTLFISTLLCISCFISCIQDEAPNAEADIHTCFVPDLSDEYRSGGKTIPLSLGAHLVNIWVKPNMFDKLPDEIQLTPEFTLTDGATIYPYSGTTLTFKKSEQYEQTYTVTAEDGKHLKDYVVKISPQAEFLVGEDNTRYFSFEYYDDSEKFHTLYDIFDGEVDKSWTSANGGFSVVHGAAPAEEYPTYCTENGYKGRGVKVTTCYVGKLGEWSKMPIAAGNFFIGTFEKDQAMKAPLQSTKFGIRVMQKPTHIDFWYKFHREPKYTDEKLNVLPDMIEYPDVYAVFFKPKKDKLGNDIPLDGSNILTADNIVLLAKLNYDDVIVEEGDIETAEYHHMDIPFTPQNGLEVDEDILNDGGYYLTIVFTSSYKGDLFYGAIGSCMYIDELTVHFEPKTNSEE